MDFEKSCPSGGRGKKRGSMDWSELIHEYEAKVEMEDRRKRRKVDWEFFVQQMKTMRGGALTRPMTSGPAS